MKTIKAFNSKVTVLSVLLRLLLMLPLIASLFCIWFGLQPFGLSEEVFRWTLASGMFLTVLYGVLTGSQNPSFSRPVDMVAKLGCVVSVSGLVFGRLVGIGYLLPEWLGSYDILLIFTGWSMVAFKPGCRVLPFFAAFCMGISNLHQGISHSLIGGLLGMFGSLGLVGLALTHRAFSYRESMRQDAPLPETGSR